MFLSENNYDTNNKYHTHNLLSLNNNPLLDKIQHERNYCLQNKNSAQFFSKYLNFRKRSYLSLIDESVLLMPTLPLGFQGKNWASFQIGSRTKVFASNLISAKFFSISL